MASVESDKPEEIRISTASKDISQRLAETVRKIEEKRRLEVAQLLSSGTDKEPFDPAFIFRVCNGYRGEQLEKALQNGDWVENLRQEYYLDHPSIKTNDQFARMLDEQQ